MYKPIMYKFLVGFLVLISAPGSLAIAQKTPYATYEQAQKTITELEWRLLQAQLPLTAKEAYLSFDAPSRRFSLTVWITTFDAARQSPSETRDLFASTVDLAKSLLELHFPEFKIRGSKDIRAQLLLGRSGRDELGVFDGSSVKLTDAYYEYLREVGRR